MASGRQELDDAITRYLQEVASLQRGDIATPEVSYYPAVKGLLEAFASQTRPKRGAIAQPAGREGDFPDVALVALSSDPGDPALADVVVAPVEVKPATYSTADLLGLDQGVRYARTFGGGYVLLTNLKDFIWASEDGGSLRELESVSLLTDDDLTKKRLAVSPDASDRLFRLVTRAAESRRLIADPRRVAHLLAICARRILEHVEQRGDTQHLLKPLAQSLEQGLGMKLDEEFFASTIVQTLVYALFAAWLDCSDPLDFTWSGAEHELRSPVMSALLNQVEDPQFVRECNLRPHLDDIVSILALVDRDEFVSRFSIQAIEYFYEPFLAEFDPALRDRLGVWYTPVEIADYMVARVDHHLRNDFGITLGLADDSVTVLDPACGTGTYLAALYRFIYNRHIQEGRDPATAARRTRAAAVSRLYGFEILPAALAIAHISLARVLDQLGAPLDSSQRTAVYLTNSLLGWEEKVPSVPLTGFEQELSAAHDVKTREEIIVVIGNPPYQGYSKTDNPAEAAVLWDWKEPLHHRWGVRKGRMDDLYVRFWRMAVRRTAELQSRGIVSFITNRKWLVGRSFPSMREAIVQGYHDVVIDDLHGDVHDRTHPGDGSVFTTSTMAGIQRGVAIVTAVRKGDKEDGVLAHVCGRDLRGTGPDKRAQLKAYAATDLDAELQQRTCDLSTRYRLSGELIGAYPNVGEYFDFVVSGVQAVRDDAVVDLDRDRLAERMRDFFDAEIRDAELRERHPGFAVRRQDFNLAQTRSRLLAGSGFNERRIIPFLYRPFDVRWLYWEPEAKLLNRPRPDLMPYYYDAPDQVFLSCPQTPRRIHAARPSVGNSVPCFESADPNCRVMPLWGVGYESREADLLGGQVAIEFGATRRVPNIEKRWVDAVKAITGGDEEAAAQALFYSLVAIMNSPEWLDAVPIDGDDFSEVPVPADARSLRDAETLGRKIADLSNPLAEVSGVTTKIRDDLRYLGVPVVEPGKATVLSAKTGQQGGVWDDALGAGRIVWGDGHWANVPRQVWDFVVGGYPVIGKWLSYRVGRTLSDEDLDYVSGLVRRIAALLDLADECNRLYNAAAKHPLEA